MAPGKDSACLHTFSARIQTYEKILTLRLPKTEEVKIMRTGAASSARTQLLQIQCFGNRRNITRRVRD